MDNIDHDDSLKDINLAKAYAEDKERKLSDDSELQAAKDYLNVLLREVEGRNEEIKDKDKEKSELERRLAHTEEEIEDLKAAKLNQESTRKSAKLIGVLAGLEFVMILFLVFMILIKNGNVSIIPSASNDQDVEQNIGTEVEAEEPIILTDKHTTDLQLKAQYISSDSIAPFKASVELIDGLEYLVFTDGETKVCYKNEYYKDDMEYRKAILVEKGKDRLTFITGYDLLGDIADLCPSLCKIAERNMLIFTEFNSGSTRIPECIRAVDVDSLRLYKCDNLRDKILELMSLEQLTDTSVYQDYPILMQLSTSKASYKYAISLAYFNEVFYNDYDPLEIESDFSLVTGDNGIKWSTNVKLGSSLYLGTINGSLIPGEYSLDISGARYASFAPANIEDTELELNIIPLEEIPEEYITLSGINGERFNIAVDYKVPRYTYILDNINTDDPNAWVYTDESSNVLSHKGIDVSKYQEKIDWKAVADSGVEFAIIRLGYRGMNEGTLELDPYFKENVKGATANGIKVGVYFFSQAITEEEAREEAEFVLKAIKGYNITYPVVFDTERVTTFNARANSIPYNLRTDICIRFCDTIKAAGYIPMIYANTKYMMMGIDRSRLTDYDMWFAYYSFNGQMTIPYDFQIFQYTESGTVPGVTGNCDLNISFKDY